MNYEELKRKDIRPTLADRNALNNTIKGFMKIRQCSREYAMLQVYATLFYEITKGTHSEIPLERCVRLSVLLEECIISEMRGERE